MSEITKEKVLYELEKHFREKLESNQMFKQVVFTSENILNGRMGLPVEVSFTHTAASGNVSDRKISTYFYPPYDPFTGELVNK